MTPSLTPPPHGLSPRDANPSPRQGRIRTVKPIPSPSQGLSGPVTPPSRPWGLSGLPCRHLTPPRDYQPRDDIPPSRDIRPRTPIPPPPRDYSAQDLSGPRDAIPTHSQGRSGPVTPSLPSQGLFRPRDAIPPLPGTYQAPAAETIRTQFGYSSPSNIQGHQAPCAIPSPPRGTTRKPQRDARGPSAAAPRDCEGPGPRHDDIPSPYHGHYPGRLRRATYSPAPGLSGPAAPSLPIPGTTRPTGWATSTRSFGWAFGSAAPPHGWAFG
nr:proline-rich protein 2-like [Oncorhynchus nerka]